MRNATPVFPFKTRRPTRCHYFLRVNFGPFSFFTRTTRAKINPAPDYGITKSLCIYKWSILHKQDNSIISPLKISITSYPGVYTELPINPIGPSKHYDKYRASTNTRTLLHCIRKLESRDFSLYDKLTRGLYQWRPQIESSWLYTNMRKYSSIRRVLIFVNTNCRSSDSDLRRLHCVVYLPYFRIVAAIGLVVISKHSVVYVHFST